MFKIIEQIMNPDLMKNTNDAALCAFFIYFLVLIC